MFKLIKILFPFLGETVETKENLQTKEKKEEDIQLTKQQANWVFIVFCLLLSYSVYKLIKLFIG